MAPLVRGLIVDYGGVLTTDVFASFRAFCETVVGLDLPDESVQVADWLTPAGRRFARELYLHADALEDAIER